MSFQIYKGYYAEESLFLLVLPTPDTNNDFSIAGGETSFSLKSNVVKKKIKH